MPDAVDAKTLRQARKVSSAWFGAKHRLPVAAAIAAAGDEELYAARIAETVRTSETQAGAELKRLHAAGLLEALSPPPAAPAGAVARRSYTAGAQRDVGAGPQARPREAVAAGRPPRGGRRPGRVEPTAVRPFRIRDPIHGFIKLMPDERAALDSPCMQRLRESSSSR